MPLFINRHRNVRGQSVASLGAGLNAGIAKSNQATICSYITVVCFCLSRGNRSFSRPIAELIAYHSDQALRA